MLKKKYLEMDVVQASRERIKMIFEHNKNVALSFSGGKDSIVLVDITYKMCVKGELDKTKLTVQFIDEEAMFEDVISIVREWRQKFIDMGVKFEWYCIEVKHFNCLNSLTEEESFICWDRKKEENWVRKMPRFAIKDHKFLIPRKDSYQSFLRRLYEYTNTVAIIGLRVSESVQRLKCVANIDRDKKQVNEFPIYDMIDADIWLYIKRNNLSFPKTYENLYRVGTQKNKLRISQFFSSDTAKVLVSLNEIYPNLMDRVIKREPNAYLCSMYWDTEMFGKSTRARKKIESDVAEEKDYKKLLFELFKDPKRLNSELQRKCLKYIKSFYVRNGQLFTSNDDYKKAYECVLSGDPKRRTLRAIMLDYHAGYAKGVMKSEERNS